MKKPNQTHISNVIERLADDKEFRKLLDTYSTLSEHFYVGRKTEPVREGNDAIFWFILPINGTQARRRIKFAPKQTKTGILCSK